MWLYIGLAGLAGVVAGEGLRRYVGRLGYRLATPDEQDVPAPGRRWWIPGSVAAAWALTAYAADSWASYALWLPFAVTGAYLAVVDLDVWRLPDRAQLLLGAVAVAGGVAVTWGHPYRLLVGAGAAAVCLVGFWVLHLVSRGSVGFGDVKLAATCGFVAGLGGPSAVFAALLLACVLGLFWGLIRRQRAFAFGPWLLAGTVVAGLLVRS